MNVVIILAGSANRDRLMQVIAHLPDRDTVVKWCLSLQDGLDYLAIPRDNADSVTCALLELNETDQGLSTVDTLRARYPGLPIIALLEPATRQLGLEAVRRGAQDYLILGGLTGELLDKAIQVAVERTARSKQPDVEMQSDSIQNLLTVSDSQVQMVMQVANAGTWSWCPADGDKMDWSVLTYRLLGYSPGNHTPTVTNWIRGIHPDDQARASEAFEQAASQGIGLDIECRIVRTHGMVHWLQMKGQPESSNPARISGILMDITSRKNVETVLQANEERFRALVEGNIEAIIIVAPSGRLIYATQSVAQIIGYSLDELPYLDVWATIHPAELDMAHDLLNTLRDNPGMPVTREIQLRHKTGRWCNIETTVRNMCAEPDIGGFVARFHDVTDRVEAANRERAHRLRAESLAKVTVALTSKLGLQEVLDEILVQAASLVEYKSANIALRKDNELVVSGWRGYDDVSFVAGLRQTLDQYPIDLSVVRDLKPVTLNDPAELASWVSFPETAWIRSYLGMPIVLRGQCIGILRLESATSGAFDERTIEALEPLASAAAIAIDNARLYDRLQQELVERRKAEAAALRQNRDLKLLNRVIEAATTNLAVETVMTVICHELVEGLNLTHAAAALFSEDREQLTVLADFNAHDAGSVRGLTIPVSLNPVLGMLFKDRKPVSTVDVYSDAATLPFRDYLRDLGIASGVTVPFLLGDSIAGLLGLYSSEKRESTPDELELVTSISRTVSKLLENARLYDALKNERNSLETRVIQRTEELQTAKERVEAVLTNSSEAICLVVAPDYRIEQTNRAFDGLFGAVVTLTSLVTDEDAGRLVEILNSVTASTPVQDLEFRLRRLDGILFDAEVSLASVVATGDSSQSNQIVCNLRDISERKRSERQLRYHASLQENVSDAVFATDLEFRIQSWNRAAERYYGVSAQEAIGKAPGEIFEYQFASGEDKMSLYTRLMHDGTWSGEVTEITRSGRKLRVLASAEVIKDKAGLAIGMIATNHDITERKEAEERAEETRRMLQQVLDTIPAAVFWKDRDSRYLGANHQFARDFGLASPDEVINKTDYQLAPSHAERFRKVDKEVLESESPRLSYEESFPRHGQPVAWSQTSKVPLRDANQNVIGVLGAYFDITERKLAEEALRQSETALREGERIAKLGHFRYELTTGQITASDELYNIFEIEPGLPVTADLYHQFIPQENLAHILEVARLATNADVSYHLEHPIIFPDGRRKYLSISGYPLINADQGVTHIFGTAQDITERKQAEESLRQVTSFQQAILNNTNLVIITADLEGTITSINQAGEALLGYTRADLVGKATPLILRESAAADDYLGHVTTEIGLDRSLSREEFVARLKSGQREEWEGLYRRKDGSTFPVQIMVGAMRDQSGELLGILEIASDISMRKRAEQALRVKLDEEREFQGYLKALNEVTILLTQVDDTDLFFRQVVEYALERFGFERVGLILYDQARQEASGTYGTDSQGRIQSEYHFRMPVDDVMRKTLETPDHFSFDEDVPLLDNMQPVGHGWNATAALWDGTHSVGWIFADNLVHHGSATKPMLDILALYGLTVGALLGRKRAESALRESEERFRLLMEAAPEGIIITDDMGQIVLLNREAQRIFGYTREEMINQPVDMLLPVQSQEYPAAEHDRANQERQTIPLSNSDLLTGQRKDGTRFPIEIGLSAVGTRTGVLVISFVKDITERRHIEEILKHSEADLRSVLNSTSLGFVLIGVDYRIRSVNRLALAYSEELYGSTLQVGSSMLDYLPEHIREAFKARFHRVMQGEILISEETSGKESDRRIFEFRYHPVVTDDGTFVGVNALFEDITSRKLAEEVLRKTRDQLQAVLDNSNSLIYVVDLQGRLLLANKLHARLFGIPQRELIGKQIRDLYPPRIAAEIAANNKAALDTGRIMEFSETMELPDGLHYFLSVKSTLKDEAGVPYAICAISTDVTPLKQIEQALRDALEKEKELGELKSRFVSVASHEFRTPLATIRAASDSLKVHRSKMNDEQLDAKLVKIQSQVDHLTEMINDTLTLSRAQAGKLQLHLERHDLDAFCQEIIEEFHSRGDITHRIIYACETRPLMIPYDDNFMRKVVSNLLSNAIKYSPGAKNVYMDLTLRDSTVYLNVRDEGIGIPQRDRPRMFEAFHRASNVASISGTGLGLAITRQAVELHGGTITFETNEGRGTIFHVELPIR